MTLSSDNRPVVRKSALGKGFSSLLGDIDIPVVATAQNVTTVPEERPAVVASPVSTAPSTPGLAKIPVSEIEPNPHQPRKIFHPEDLTALSKSLREDGVLQPILVSKGDRPNRYVLIAGERRWRAAQMAGMSHVPVVIREGAPNDLLRLALIENIQRSDLNAIEEAEAYASLIKDFGYTQEQCAQRLGKERSTVANALRLLQLPRELQDDLVDGRLTMGHGRALLSLEERGAIFQAREIVLKKEMNVRQTEELCKNWAHHVAKEKQNNSAGPPRPDNTYLTESLSQHFKTKVSLSGNGSKGKIQINFTSPEEFDRILALLGLHR
jgi:ParB family chromosome partitioning protein